jgi:predicted RND superfamily exporter protein
MAEIKEQLDARALDRVDSSTRADLEMLRRYLDPGAFGFDSLPGWARRFLTEADGRTGEFGYLYGELRESDALESGKFQERFGNVPSSEGPVMVASSGFIYADVVRMVKGDGMRLAIFTFLILIVITWLDMRSWRGVLISCGFVALSSWWTFKLMGILGLKLGMFNLVVLPTILSVSVDSVIHLYHRRMELGRGKIGELYQTTGSAVLAGTLNNAFGFLGLCFVSHKGMQTIGFMATLGIGCGLLVMFTVLPWLLEALCPKEPQVE